MATCRPILFLLTMKEILFFSFYNYKFSSCTPNVVYTLVTKSFGDLEIVFASAAKRPWRQFFSQFVKVQFRILDIQITIFLQPSKNVTFMHRY
jgi:hypothetical protein